MDIVEQLRKHQCPENKGCNPVVEYCQCALMDSGADEIERLREEHHDVRILNEQYYNENAILIAEIERLREALNGAYTERNRVVALLASVFPSGLKRTSIPDWDEEWNGCVYIDLPTGQASWHFHDREAHLFSHLPPYEKEWDGHTTEEKYDRLARSALQQKESK